MRVVQVSAHYPPNFTSGGTLVPQRIARGLVARGHDVHVYAGRLDPAREPLDAWEETGDDGIPVRWIVTTPWTAWSDERNYDNPAVAADFSSWLQRLRPDVVHLHSLQTLGASLVSAAHASGARVVVTMHDFWWSCARQFLVDRDGRPCSLVVACGGCECQVDHEWLRARNRLLARHVADADLVLAPSRSAAQVLVANGVDERRLRVDENGVPDTSTGVAAAPQVRGPVRFLFAGGDDPMKGLPVLLDALPSVRAERDWSIDLYGVDGPLGDAHAVARPAFAPEHLPEVLAGGDVLVLPSVMRESHSILTREALGAGLAVVCTDSLGPQEVVREGVNGLVVPAADPDSLAAALRRLADDPDLVERMRRAAPDVRVRSVDEQIDGLVETYHQLLQDADEPDSARGPAGGPSSWRRRLDRVEDDLLRSVVFVVGIDGAPLRYRAHLPAEALALTGARCRVLHYRDPRVPGAVRRADAVVLYRVPATEQVLHLVRDVQQGPRAVPVLFDVDDLIVDPSLRGQVHGLEGMAPEEEELWWRGVARYRTTLEACDGYIGSTAALCSRIGALTGKPTYRFANGVGAVMARLSDQAAARPRRPGGPRIGYFSGTTTHDADWAIVEPAVLEVLATYRDAELWLGGHLTTTPAMAPYADRVHRYPMVAWTQLPDLLRQVDVNLAPLVLDSVFNESKSAIKWLEAALVGTPTVASPTEPFREAIVHGDTGMLATTTQEWVEAISALVDDPSLAARMGQRAGRSALLRWSPPAQAAAYRQILRDGLERRLVVGPTAASAWVPVADDEPYGAGVDLERYPPAAGSARRTLPLVRQSRAVVRVLRVDGVRGLVRSARRRLRR